jgi:hypothetical protein
MWALIAKPHRIVMIIGLQFWYQTFTGTQNVSFENARKTEEKCSYKAPFIVSIRKYTV